MEDSHTTASRDLDSKLEQWVSEPKTAGADPSNRLSQTVATLEGELTASQALAQLHQRELKSVEDSESTYRRELNERRSQIGELINTVESLRKTLQEKEAEITKANEQLTTLQGTGEQSHGEMEELKARVLRLTFELESASSDQATVTGNQQRIEVSLPPLCSVLGDIKVSMLTARPSNTKLKNSRMRFKNSPVSSRWQKSTYRPERTSSRSAFLYSLI